MLLFSTIYDKAVHSFDDPEINRAYVQNKIRFQKLMYPYLVNGIDSFHSPSKLVMALGDIEPPKGDYETFEGNGGDTYATTILPLDNSEFLFSIDNVIDEKAVYDAENKTVKFSREVLTGETAMVQWYFCGQFNTDFSSCATSNCSADYIADKILGILSNCCVLARSDLEKNTILEIKNILTDTDFKIYSPANSVRAKVDWNKHIRYEVDTLQSELSWSLYARRWHGGNFYGN